MEIFIFGHDALWKDKNSIKKYMIKNVQCIFTWSRSFYNKIPQPDGGQKEEVEGPRAHDEAGA